MVPLDNQAISHVLAWDLGEHRGLSLRHALLHNRHGLIGDHPRSPRSVLLIRPGAPPEGWHVFGAGLAEPAIGWLARLGRSFSLLAPDSWEGAIRRRSTTICHGVVETWVQSVKSPEPPRPSPSIATRRLTRADARTFANAAPDWALQGWDEFKRLVDEGAAVAVPTLDGGFASVAWVFEADHDHDSIAVATVGRFQRLGLGRAAALALIKCVESERRRTPLWKVNSTNIPSKALARSLGFSPRLRENVLRWSS